MVMWNSVVLMACWASRGLSISTPDDTLGPLYTFNFVGDQTVVVKTSLATECMGGIFPVSIPAGAWVGNAAIVKNYDPDYKTCWGPPYAHDLFPLQNGTFSGTDGTALEAYTVSPPQAPAAQWSASGMSIYYKATQNGNMSVYSFDGTFFTLVTVVVGNSSSYVKAVDVTATKKNTTYIFAPSGKLITSFRQPSANVEGAVISSSANPVWRFTMRRFQVGGRPYVTEVDFNAGSGSHDSQKQFFPITRADSSEGILHQDQTSMAILMVWFGADMKSATTVQLLNTGDVLAGAVSDGQTQVVVLTANRTANPDKVTQAPVTAYKFDSTTGAQLTSMSIPVDAGLNNYAYQPYGASMVWSQQQGTIGFIYAHLNPMSSDGLNHQSSDAVILNASTLNVTKIWGLVTSHSFGHTTILDSVGNFLSMELGDNNPRGIKMSNYNASWITGRVVYSFKTYHMTSAGWSNVPVYTDISGNGRTFYKWSNDNNMYTELAHPGILEANDGYLAFFAGERPSLDNSKCSGGSFNMARNIGFVKVPKDLNNQSWLSTWGTQETGGFYSYWGDWNVLYNNGTVWLTNYTDPLNSVSRLHAVQLDSTSILLLWELWGNARGSYNKTQFMVVDWSGNVLQPITNLNATMQLGIGEEPILRNGRLVAYSGTTGGQIVRFELCLYACSPPPTTTAAAAGTGGTTTAAPSTVPTQIKGTMKLSVPNPANYVNNTSFKTGLVNALAKTLGGVNPTWITLTLTLARRLLEAAARQLQSSISVSYTVTVPTDGSAGNVTAAGLATTMSSATPSSFSTVLALELSKAGSDANVTVASINPVQAVSPVIQTPTGHSSNSAFSLMNCPVLSTALVVLAMFAAA